MDPASGMGSPQPRYLSDLGVPWDNGTLRRAVISALDVSAPPSRERVAFLNPDMGKTMLDGCCRHVG